MKKILALALVLVLALGMMVPAHAKIGVKTVYVPVTDYHDVGDIGPDWTSEDLLSISFADITLNDDAEKALLAATSSAQIQSVMNKVADSLSARVRARKGGALFTVDVLDAKFVGTKVFGLTVAETAAELTKLGVNGSALGTGDIASETAFTDYLKHAAGGNLDPTKSADLKLYNKALSMYKSYLVVTKDLDDWLFIVELEAPEIPWASVAEIDFEIDILLDNDGRSDNFFYWTITGTLANEIVEVDADHDFANGYDGHVIKATEYVPKIAICGNYDDDVIAHVKMAKDKKIFFVAVVESDMADESVFDRYPSIEWAYKILQVGLNAYTGNFIELGSVDSSYYVYGKDASGSLKYLGRGGELLPLSAKYYISTQKLDLSSDEPVDEIPVDVPTVVDDYNPSTGI